MNDMVRETLRLVFSSTRPMPAHFTSNGDRNQSFCIDFEPLTPEDDYLMASESWGITSDFLSAEKIGNEDFAKDQFYIITRCGEDLMVGSFILTKLGGREFVVEMKKEILKDTIENFEKENNLTDIFASEQVNKYFDYCIEYGYNQAIKK